MKVLVTGARAHFSLPIIRALAARGHVVTTADWDSCAIGAHSRHVRMRWAVPRVSVDPLGFVECVAERLRNDPHDIVIPVFEEALALSRYRDLLPSTTLLPVSSYDQMMRVHDKRRLWRMACDIGVPTPRTSVTAEPWVDMPSFDVVIKVPQSNSSRGVLIIGRGMDVRTNWNSLRSENGAPTGTEAVVQERIDGRQLCVLCVAWHGIPKATLCYENLCEYPSFGGTSALRMSVANRRAVELSHQIVKETRWHGSVGFDYLIDGSTGECLLIDGNPRLTPGVRLSYSDGFDIDELLTASSEPVQQNTKRVGSFTRTDPLLIACLVQRVAAILRLRGGSGGMLRLLGPMLRSCSDVFDGFDIMPIVAMVRTVMKLAPSAMGGQRAALDVIGGSTYADYSGC